MDKNGTHFLHQNSGHCIISTTLLQYYIYYTTQQLLSKGKGARTDSSSQRKTLRHWSQKKKIETMSNFLPRPVLSGKGIYTFSSTLSGKQGSFIVQCTRCKDHTCALTKNELGVLTNHFTSNNVNFEMKLPVHKSSKKLVMPNPTTLPSSYLQCKRHGALHLLRG